MGTSAPTPGFSGYRVITEKANPSVSFADSSPFRGAKRTPRSAIAAQPGALLNKGSRNLASPTAERQRAGKGAQPQVSTRAGQDSTRLPFRMAPPGSGASAPVIFGYFPSLESTSPAGETSPPRPQAELLSSPGKADITSPVPSPYKSTRSPRRPARCDSTRPGTAGR